MDREALEHSLARRLLDHVEHRTTDMADEVLELPTDIYSPERHEEEVRALFLERPIVLCQSGALQGPGAYRTLDMCGTPVLLTRDKNGRVRSFANICRHRGVRVMDGAGTARRFTCPFHAWSYGLDGSLQNTPTPEGFEGMCRDDKGLIELPVAEGYGLIVGRLRPGPEVDIDDFLGPDLAGELAIFDFSDWEVLGEPHMHHVASNWKVALDTFRENYHFNYLHRTTLATYAYGGTLTFDPFGLHLRNCSAIRSIDSLRGIPESEWGDVSQHISPQYALFPNVSLTLDARHSELWQILPISTNECEVLHTVYVRKGISEVEREKLTEMAPWICEKVVDGEDFWVAGRTEPGIRTGMLDKVVFGKNEPAPQHLHRGYETVLAESRTRSS